LVTQASLRVHPNQTTDEAPCHAGDSVRMEADA
jgi:hypothetical protein